MSDPVSKVTKLIALTASSNESEAKNAAVRACALIRRHELVVVDDYEDDDEGASGSGDRRAEELLDFVDSLLDLASRPRKKKRRKR